MDGKFSREELLAAATSVICTRYSRTQSLELFDPSAFPTCFVQMKASSKKENVVLEPLPHDDSGAGDVEYRIIFRSPAAYIPLGGVTIASATVILTYKDPPAAAATPPRPSHCSSAPSLNLPVGLSPSMSTVGFEGDSTQIRKLHSHPADVAAEKLLQKNGLVEGRIEGVFFLHQHHPISTAVKELICRALPSSNYLSFNPLSNDPENGLKITHLNKKSVDPVNVETAQADPTLAQLLTDSTGTDQLLQWISEQVYSVHISGSSTHGWGDYDAKTKSWANLRHKHKRGSPDDRGWRNIDE